MNPRMMMTTARSASRRSVPPLAQSLLLSKLRLSQPPLSKSNRGTSIRKKKREAKRNRVKEIRMKLLKGHLKLSRGEDLMMPRRARRHSISFSNSRRKTKTRTSPIATKEEGRISVGSLATLIQAAQEVIEAKAVKATRGSLDKSALLE
jgi:hypothetical protein